MFPDLVPSLKAGAPDLRGRLLPNVALSELTWLRVGGPAQALFTPADEEDLAYFLSRCPREMPVIVIGVGSNLLVRDGGVPGVVIRLARGFNETAALDATRLGLAPRSPMCGSRKPQRPPGLRGSPSIAASPERWAARFA